ncbi:MAG: tetratricopeptide repeat protein, partial [Phycisphaerales bacterium]
VLGQLTSGAVVKRTENPINLPADMLGDEDSKFLVRWATPLYTFTKASWMMAWPWPLIHDYSIPALPEIRRFGDPRLWAGVGWLAVFLIVLGWSYVRNRKLLVAIGLALVPYSIVSNLVIIIGTVFGERLLYAPSAGACMALGLVLSPPFSRPKAITAHGKATDSARPSRSRAALVVAMILSLAAIAYGYSVVQRNRDWRSPEALVLSVGDHERTSFKVLGSFAEMALREGSRHLAEGDEQAAQAAFQRSLDYAQRGLQIAPETWGPHSARGLALWHLGQNEEALKVLAHALQLGAAYDPRTLFAAGHLMVEVEGDYATGVELLEMVLQRHPTPLVRVKTHNDLAMFLITAPEGMRHQTTGLPVRDLAKALKHAQEAVRLSPTDGAIRDTLVRVLLALGRRDDAIAALKEALIRIPTDDSYRSQLQDLLDQLTAS